MVLLAKTKWLKSTNELQSCLDINFSSCYRCQGHSKNKPTCDNPINQASRSELPSVVLYIINSGSLASASNHLERLAKLVLCKRSHQAQATDLATQWRSRIRVYLGIGRDSVASKKESKGSVRPHNTTTSSPQPMRRAAQEDRTPTPTTAILPEEINKKLARKPGAPCHCEIEHQGFSEAEISRAKAVEEMLQAWARLRAFDEESKVTPQLSRRLIELDLDDSTCWEVFVSKGVRGRQTTINDGDDTRERSRKE
ncbi:hypothetical protein CORC01_09415 [Colletotrichum orchidophilum]|uniref:Uncharacterized protein n=1 Tax=Colletotrichum orchidophilum TaxID=1209926 RepID=A0A1G4B1H5_9PEZI|nr:uncharacterized protein CORC01_09415 [Colletotrichum orchidophilum]OHE95270.1 hypothetical protein CORC01_09415 [Colletotrichum orchidophilum]